MTTLTGVLSIEELPSIIFRKGSGFCWDPKEDDVASEKLRSMREEREGVGDGVLGAGFVEGGTVNEDKVCGTADNKLEACIISPEWWFGEITGEGILICGGEEIKCCEF